MSYYIYRGLLNPFLLVLTSETVLKHYCPDGLLFLTSESILECFKDLLHLFRLVLTSESILKNFLSGGFFFWPKKVFWNIFVQKCLLNPYMLALSSETTLEYFRQEGFTRSVQIELVLKSLVNSFMIYFVLKGLPNHE